MKRYKPFYKSIVFLSFLSVTICYSTQTIYAQDLFVGSCYTHEVFRYDGLTGEAQGTFASSGMSGPRGIAFGPNGNLYVASPGNDSVVEYDGSTGAFIRVFCQGNEIYEANQLLFGPNGDLYVSNVPSGSMGIKHRIVRYDGVTGQLIGIFATEGLWNPQDMLFLPNGNMIVANSLSNNVLEFNGATGSLIGEFITAGAGGLVHPHGMAWAKNGNLLVTSLQTDSILEYDCVTGDFVRIFVSGEGLSRPRKLQYGPNGNLFVANDNTDYIAEFDGVTGEFIGSFTTGASFGHTEGITFKPPTLNTIFYEDFETDLDQWTGKEYGAHNGILVDDPLDANNQVLSFSALNGGGDVYSIPELKLHTGQTYKISFKYLGKEIVGVSVPDDFGGFLGLSDNAGNPPLGDHWIFGTRESYPGIRGHLIDDNTWHTYEYVFEWQKEEYAASDDTIHIMIQDFGNSGGGPGDVFFDNIRIELIHEPEIIYVDPDAPGANDGTSWENAYNFLQEALTEALNGDEIRIAQGIYTPDSSTASPEGTGDKTATFLVEGYTIKGGYAGWGEDNPDNRDVAQYRTVLSGDLAGDDPLIESLSDLDDISTKGDNSLIVVTTLYNTTIDGVVFTGGFNPDGNGGGVSHSANDLELISCTLIGNIARNGAGCYSPQGNLLISDCDIEYNKAMAEGGGLYQKSNFAVYDSSFNSNSAVNGGGAILSRNGGIIENTSFSENNGHNGGTINSDSDTQFSLTNCKFTDNQASGYGGAISALTNMIIEECIFERCTSGGYGGALSFWSGRNVTIKNSTFKECHSQYGSGAIGGLRTFLSIYNCDFINNTTGGDGGALGLSRGSIYLWMSDSVRISKCNFVNNSSSIGGAISGGSHARIYIDNTTFLDNSTSGRGGAIVVNGIETMTIEKSIFSNNESTLEGGAVYSWDSPLDVQYTTFYDNLTNVKAGPAIYLGGARILHMDNSICFASNPSDPKSFPYFGIASDSIAIVKHSCLYNDSIPGDGNIYVNPLFNDPANNDFHLKSQGGRYNPVTQTWIYDEVTSPCIDGGDSMSPIGNELFPNGGIVNMGAYGGTVEASKSYFGTEPCEIIIAGDINGDCVINLLDFSILSLHWLEDYNP